jgi:hypothetical protein
MQASNAWLAVRSLAWTLLIPGIFAGYVPWRYFGLGQVRLDLTSPTHLVALLCIAAGAVLEAACIWEFARSGRGTLSPADPPKDLVIRGLYRYVRNPMYLSVTLIILGEFLLTGSRDSCSTGLSGFSAPTSSSLATRSPPCGGALGEGTTGMSSASRAGCRSFAERCICHSMGPGVAAVGIGGTCATVGTVHLQARLASAQQQNPAGCAAKTS